jgi:hypothetical protein
MVKIKDFSEKELENFNVGTTGQLPWDVVEDLIVYMQNEPSFYRRKMYPALLDVQSIVRKGGKFNKKKLIPIVDDAIKSYIKKYEIKKRPEELLTDSEKMSCIDRLLKNESDNFRKGFY